MKSVKSVKNAKTIDVTDDEIISLVVEWLKKNNINFMYAPFEGEWKCVFLEKKGIVDAIMSTDGDYIALGANKVFCEVNFID